MDITDFALLICVLILIYKDIHHSTEIRRLRGKVTLLEDWRDMEISKRMMSVDWVEDLLGQVKKAGGEMKEQSDLRTIAVIVVTVIIWFALGNIVGQGALEPPYYLHTDWRQVATNAVILGAACWINRKK